MQLTLCEASFALVVVAVLIYLYDSYAYRFYIKESEGIFHFTRYRSILIREGHFLYDGRFKRQSIQWLVNPMDAKLEKHFRRYYVVCDSVPDQPVTKIFAGHQTVAASHAKKLRFYVDYIDKTGEIIVKEFEDTHRMMTDLQCHGINLSRAAEFYLTFTES